TAYPSAADLLRRLRPIHAQCQSTKSLRDSPLKQGSVQRRNVKAQVGVVPLPAPRELKNIPRLPMVPRSDAAPALFMSPICHGDLEPSRILMPACVPSPSTASPGETCHVTAPYGRH